MRNTCKVGIAGLGTLLLSVSANAEVIYLTNGSNLFTTDNTSLAAVTTVPITNLQLGETLVGIDVRPASPGTLYGVGSANRVYTIDRTSGRAVVVGSASQFTLNGTAFGTDFNPVPDRIRQVSNTEQNLRLNPNDGTLSGTDTLLTPAGNIVAVAYDRNFTRFAGNTTPTTLFGIDSVAGTLVRIGGVDGSPSPNLGAVTSIGSLNLGTNLNENIGFDISGGTGTLAFASITVGGQSRLYTVDLTTGAATNRGTIGAGVTPFLGLAAASAPEPGTFALLGVAATGLLLRRRRAARV